MLSLHLAGPHFKAFLGEGKKVRFPATAGSNKGLFLYTLVTGLLGSGWRLLGSQKGRESEKIGCLVVFIMLVMCIIVESIQSILCILAS